MSRPSNENICMQNAIDWSLRSTCARVKTGTVIAKDHRVISVGYNGVPADTEHCCDRWPKGTDINSEKFHEEHHAYSAVNEQHAEVNAITFAAREGISTKGATLFTLLSPCERCALQIITAGIVRVYYNKKYDRSEAGILKLQENGIRCDQLDGIRETPE